MDQLERLGMEFDKKVGKITADHGGIRDKHMADKVSILTGQQVRRQKPTAILVQANAALDHVLSLCQVHAN
jgi:flagellin-like hook-associated protein FlgL